jgi:hypothetical protein
MVSDNPISILKLFLLQAVVGNKRTVAVVIVRIYNYLCNQCLSQLKLWVWITLMASWTRYNIMWYSLSVTYDRFLPPITLTSSLEARNYIFLVTKIDWLVFQLLSWSEHETKIHVSIVKKEALIWTYGRIYRLSQTKQDIVYTVGKVCLPKDHQRQQIHVRPKDKLSTWLVPHN